MKIESNENQRHTITKKNATGPQPFMVEDISGEYKRFGCEGSGGEQMGGQHWGLEVLKKYKGNKKKMVDDH